MYGISGLLPHLLQKPGILSSLLTHRLNLALFSGSQKTSTISKKDGFNLTLIKYHSGAASLDGVINGEADLVIGVTEFPPSEKRSRT